MDMGEIVPEKKVVYEIGCDLDALSIEELGARISLMQNEIERLESAIENKKKSASDADVVFRF